MVESSSISLVFRKAAEAIKNEVLIQRESRLDKEFHFQNWFENRLKDCKLNYDRPGRNSYPDFRLVKGMEGYEVKGLAYPGRKQNYDNNSQVPSGFDNGRTIYYVFGRYPKKVDGNTFPILDLVICHGDFLNADHDYVHENKHVKGFGSYGDILIRIGRCTYGRTPFFLADGIAHHQTLVLPSETELGEEFFKVGELVRREADELVVRYSFDLQSNDLKLEKIPNPNKGREA